MPAGRSCDQVPDPTIGRSMNHPLILLSAPNCELCGHARSVLEGLERETWLAWREVSTETSEGARLEQTAPPLRPVLLDSSGEVLACGRLSAKRLRRDLMTAAEHG